MGSTMLYAGPTFEVITNANTGQVIGNYTLVYTQLDANTLAASLPSSFNASQVLGVGDYTAVFTYLGTSNFLNPTPLTVQFSIAVCLFPSPSFCWENSCICRLRNGGKQCSHDNLSKLQIVSPLVMSLPALSACVVKGMGDDIQP